MNIRRSAVGAAVLGNKIYVIGGYDGNSSLNSVECYDAEMNQWKFVASMSTLRSAAGVASLNSMSWSFLGLTASPTKDFVIYFNNINGRGWGGGRGGVGGGVWQICLSISRFNLSH